MRPVQASRRILTPDPAGLAITDERDPLRHGSAPPLPIRVCFLIDRLGYGGTELQLVALIRALDRRLVAPHLALLDGSDPESRALEPAECPVLRLGVRRLLRPRTLVSLSRFVRFLRRAKIDVLQAYFADSACFALVAGKLARIPCLVRTRNNAHRSDTRVQQILARLLGRFATLTVANSEAARGAVVEEDGADPRTVVVVPNGADPGRFSGIPLPDSEDAATARSRKVGMVANLRRVKGVDVFVRAAPLVKETHPAVSFHVVGEGPDRGKLEALVAELGLAKSFRLEGRCSDVAGFLADLDVAVLSSRSEGMPNAVLEYMAAGRPIVATAVPGVVSLLRDGEDGILVPPDSPPHLAAAIGTLLADRKLAARVAATARARARSEFSIEAKARIFSKLWRDCLLAKAHRRPE